MKFSEFVQMWIEKSIEAESNHQTIFVEYSAHVKVLHIRIFVNGWQSGANPSISINFEAW